MLKMMRPGFLAVVLLVAAPLGQALAKAGDLILSGTPSGVGAVNRGDKLHGHIDGIGDLEVRVV